MNNFLNTEYIKNMSRFFVFLLFFLRIILGNYELCDISLSLYPNKEVSIPIIKNLSENDDNRVIFDSQPIPSNIYKKMIGKSIPLEYKNDINMEELSYLQISYYGYDGKTHVGEMIVNINLAKDVLEIFKELYEIKYPIEKIKLIDEYEADDELSMSDNNTSCFCYRVISGTSTISNHAKR